MRAWRVRRIDRRSRVDIGGHQVNAPGGGINAHGARQRRGRDSPERDKGLGVPFLNDRKRAVLPVGAEYPPALGVKGRAVGTGPDGTKEAWERIKSKTEYGKRKTKT